MIHDAPFPDAPPGTMRLFPRPGILLAAFLILLSFPLYPQIIPPNISAPIALVADAATGTILMEKNADRPIPPASLAK